VQGCQTWHVRGRAYVKLVKFIPLQGWLLVRISVTLSNMSDSLFTTTLIEMHVEYYVDYIIMMYLLYSYAYYLELF
jgi:hypothetical protein